jgi:hypothetical protein
MTFKPIFNQDTDECAEMRSTLIASFERNIYLADNNMSTCEKDEEAVVKAANIVQSILKHGDVSPEEHENFSTKLKSVFKRQAERATTNYEDKDLPLHSAAAISAIYDTLHLLDAYGQHKNRFGTLKHIT